jgi:RNA polymerase sigma-70 factor (ECF subfamily)
MIPIEDVMNTLGAEDQDDGLSNWEIDGLLKCLKSRQREIVQSISINGSSVRETADRLHISEGAVRVALHRALKTLADRYRSETS